MVEKKSDIILIDRDMSTVTIYFIFQILMESPCFHSFNGVWQTVSWQLVVVDMDLVNFFMQYFQIGLGIGTFNIACLELLTVGAAVKLWVKHLHNKRVVIYCDNEASVHAINHGRVKDKYLLACLRELWFFAAKFHFDLKAIHIPGVENRIPDYLSRWQLSSVYEKKFTESNQDLGLNECILDDSVFTFEYDW